MGAPRAVAGASGLDPVEFLAGRSGIVPRDAGAAELIGGEADRARDRLDGEIAEAVGRSPWTSCPLVTEMGLNIFAESDRQYDGPGHDQRDHAERKRQLHVLARLNRPRPRASTIANGVPAKRLVQRGDCGWSRTGKCLH